MAALAVALVTACTPATGGSPATPPAPVSGVVAIGDGVLIEYRDYGGSGPSIVLLTGLGNSAAVYDDLAPRLTADHHVIALSRRGFGLSTTTEGGYDIDTRVADDLAALDALGIDRALLVGHSIAGDELTGIAQKQPQLLTGLVYIDAALNRSHPSIAVFGECAGKGPSAEDVVSLKPEDTVTVDGMQQYVTWEAVAALRAADLGGPIPAEELRRQFARTTGGWFDVIDRVPAMNAISAASYAWTPDYRGIDVPMTTLFADNADPAAPFPAAALAGPDVRAALMECAQRLAGATYDIGIGQVTREAPNAVIEIVDGAPHYIFLQQPDLVAQRILETAARSSD